MLNQQMKIKLLYKFYVLISTSVIMLNVYVLVQELRIYVSCMIRMQHTCTVHEHVVVEAI